MNIFSDMMSGLSDVASTDKGLYVQTGLNWLFALFTWMMFVHGFRILYVNGFHGPEGEKAYLYKTLATWFVLYSVLSFYVEFVDLISGQMKDFAHMLSNQSESVIYDTMLNFDNNLNSSLPVVPSWMQWARYFVLEFFLTLAEGAIWAVVAFGFIALAAAKIVGPLFLPFGIIPSAQFLAWGWFRSFIQYAFYPVGATVFTVIVARMLSYVGNHYFTTKYLSSVDTWLMIGPLILFFGAITYGALQWPNTISNWFSGRAGETGVFRMIRQRL